MTDGPYRTPGDERLGAVVRSFSTPRRARYAGSARAAARPRYLSFGAMAPSSSPSTTLVWTRTSASETVDVCERGLRLRGRTGVLELLWDQIAAWTPVEQGAYLLSIDLRGSHGEQVSFDRRLRGLDELHALVSARLAAALRP